MSSILRNSLLPEGERFALLVLADFGNDDGIGIYAGQKTIAARMNVNKKTVQRRLTNLQECGVLECDYKAHAHGNGEETNEYRIRVDRIGKEDISKVKRRRMKAETREKFEGRDRVVARGEVETALSPPVETALSLGVETALSQKPLVEPSVNPLVCAPAKPDAPAKERDLFFDKLTEITQAEPKLQGAQIGKTKAQLIKASATLEELDKFKAYWYAQDWRGKQGQAPTLPQIVAEWGRARVWDGKTAQPQSPKGKTFTRPQATYATDEQRNGAAQRNKTAIQQAEAQRLWREKQNAAAAA